MRNADGRALRRVDAGRTCVQLQPRHPRKRCTAREEAASLLLWIHAPAVGLFPPRFHLHPIMRTPANQPEDPRPGSCRA